MSSFAPPDDFKLALLTLELEYAKARANRNDEVSYNCSWCRSYFVLDQCGLMHYLGFSAGCCCACPTTSEEVSGSGMAQSVTIISPSSVHFHWVNFNVNAIHDMSFVCYWIMDCCSLLLSTYYMP